MKENWQLVKLRDVCIVDKQHHSGKPLPYVGLEHIESGTGRFLGDSQPLTVKSSTFNFNSRHLLYGRLRPYLNKAFLPDFEGHCSTEIFPFKPISNLDRKFLFYWIIQKSIVNKINDTSTGTRMPRANINAVLEFPLFVPALAEQERIVSILDEAFAGIEAAIANTEKNLANARELFEATRDSTFFFAPDSWEMRNLNELCSIKHGFAFKSEYFTTQGNYVVLTPGSFWERGGFRNQGKKTKFYSGEIPPGFVLSKGDFLIAMTEQAAGLLGSSLIVPESDKYLHNQRLGLVEVLSGVQWENDFFFHQLNTRAFRDSVQATASGVKVRHTSPTKLGAITVKFPSTRLEQADIAERLNELEAESDRLQVIYAEKLSALTELKQSLLQKVFSGELTANKLETEVEEAVA